MFRGDDAGTEKALAFDLQRPKALDLELGLAHKGCERGPERCRGNGIMEPVLAEGGIVREQHVHVFGIDS